MAGKRRIHLVLLGVALLALSACGITPKTPLPAGTVAPDFYLGSGDQEVSLADYRGRVTIVAFWASP